MAVPSSGDGAADDDKAALPAQGPGYGLSWRDANEAVDEYRNSRMCGFPFVDVDVDVSAQELFLAKPCLLRALLATTTTGAFSLRRQAAMKRNMAAYLGQHLLMNEERSLDLLQGLLVFIAW